MWTTSTYKSVGREYKLVCVINIVIGMLQVRHTAHLWGLEREPCHVATRVYLCYFTTAGRRGRCDLSMPLSRCSASAAWFANLSANLFLSLGTCT